MKTLLKNGQVVNVFTDSLMKADVLIEDEMIVGLGSYDKSDADTVEDVSGKYICPGFIDGHIHIESSMLRPVHFAGACLPHGTTSVVADPHEIANVAGLPGIAYMLEASEGLPMTVYYVVPSCVPATPLDEAGAILSASVIPPLYTHPRVLGLGEVMNYPGVIAGDPDLKQKLRGAKERGLIVNGHAPMLSGRELDKYISAGIFDDHECSSAKEAMERLEKGQWVMIRQGTAARNLERLLPLFDEPYSRRCLLVTDDKHPADLLESGHIDSIIRQAVKMGKSVFTGIRMATLQAAERFQLPHTGAVAPGRDADLLVLDDLNEVKVRDVYHRGQKVVSEGAPVPFAGNHARPDIWRSVRNSFFMEPLKKGDFHIEPRGNTCRVIGIIPDQLITEEKLLPIDFARDNGIDLDRDILKLAVIERHNNTGHIGLGFITGMGLKKGAVASSVSHDSHNLIVAGTNEEDMLLAANRVREMSGGLVVADGNAVTAEMPLPVGGLMGLENAEETARQNAAVRAAAKALGAPEGIEPFMNLAFVSLPVIPDIKMTTHGLVDVNTQTLLPLFADED